MCKACKYWLAACCMAGVFMLYPYVNISSGNSDITELSELSEPRMKISPAEILNWGELVEHMALSKLRHELLYNKFKSFLQKNKNKIKVIVDISEQSAYVYNPKEKNFIDFVVSTGGPEHYKRMTPAIWRIREKRETGLSRIYGPRLLFLSRMVYGKFISTTIALHGTDTPGILGTPRSLGCVYFRNQDILRVYSWLSVGDYVLTVN